jgi:radical SAM superfamily enzyme YgiQ (UPF0313 family)
MHYEGLVIRPPSEADSIILQVSVGCSHNKCTFCGAYKDVGFRCKSESEIEQDLKFAAQHCRRQKRIFLCDGDALILSQSRLEELFSRIGEHLPWVKRISLYANARSVRSKSVADLEALKARGLDRVYFGLESGDDRILKDIGKGETAATQCASATKIVRAGLYLSVSVLLGIGGKDNSLEHARLTAEAINRIQPAQIAALTLMPLVNTPLGELVRQNKFTLPGPVTTAMELREMLRHITVDRVQFMANHASNYVVLSGRLQRDKAGLLEQIDATLSSPDRFVPENLRRL